MLLRESRLLAEAAAPAGEVTAALADSSDTGLASQAAAHEAVSPALASGKWLGAEGDVSERQLFRTGHPSVAPRLTRTLPNAIACCSFDRFARRFAGQHGRLALFTQSPLSRKLRAQAFKQELLGLQVAGLEQLGHG